MNQAPWIVADWPAPPDVRALSTRRFGAGVSTPPFDRFNLGERNGDDAEAVALNRAELAERLALPAAPRWLRQVHGTAVAHVDAASPGGPPPEADAAVTATPGTVLAILTADCLPVAFAARDGAEIAAAHAGWRGLAAGVLEATVRAMATPPRELIAWLGPAAGPAAYEIGEEVRDTFLAHDAAAATAFVATRPGHWKADLYALARQRLAALGLAADAVHGGDRCTISEPKHFFSHRRDGRGGRLATLVWMTE
ncbi:peptidoglycan editing factor PgeF [Lysobacter pythonis]|uniref:Purine nucleoside phosphorylase n=1 Tax=Solilutibacter pythonis TaxID=2483112 RepID=A0A3M2I3K4_9GAMM|nr:peptidoglycan editing factor PgeF [Lysobacter pythonis]RMH94189.1 peptidoglycan editing factor PgeF [Lysobacter pythonis]